MITEIGLIDVILSYAYGLAAACRGIVEVLSLQLWTTDSGTVITLGSILFGLGIPLFMTIVLTKWVLEFIT